MATIDLEASCQQTWSGRDPLGFTRQRNGSQQNSTGPVSTIRDDIDAVVDAIAHIDVKPPWLPKQRFVAGGAAAVAVTGVLFLGIRLRFHHHTPEQAAICLAFHQPAANQFRGNDLRWTAEEDVGQGWEILRDRRGGYGSGLNTCLALAKPC